MLFNELTPRQQENHRKLLAYIVGRYGDTVRSKNFGMGKFAVNIRTGKGRLILEFYPSDLDSESECKTCCCLLGHGPYAGVRVENDEWDEYSREEFGLDVERGSWIFLFSENWPDNIQEAVARLQMYINGFDPESLAFEFESGFEYSFIDHELAVEI